MQPSECPENSAEAARHVRGATMAWGADAYLDLTRPDDIEVDLVDYAYCLAYTVRWRGQCRDSRYRRPFYGVAQHCIVGAEELLEAGFDKAHARAFLFHESDEIPFGDIPGPAKALPELAGMVTLAKRIGVSINRYFGIEVPDQNLIKRWDIRTLVTEKRDLLTSGYVGHSWSHDGTGESTAGFEAFSRTIYPYTNPEEAAIRFLELASILGVGDE